MPFQKGESSEFPDKSRQSEHKGPFTESSLRLNIWITK